MNFASDNSWGVHPAVLSAISEANDGAVMGYGADPVTLRAEDALREALDAPRALVRFVATGTAANALVCAQLSPPHGRIYCHADAHIQTSECGAPEFYTHGAKLVPIPGNGGLVRPEDLARALAAGAGGGLNSGQNALVSITNATEWGRIYRPEDVSALSEVARGAGLPLHMDGARFGNAVAGAGVSAADLSWRAGVDVLCLGGTKTGAMGAEAVVFFDPDLAEGFDYRRKQAGQVWSKSRFLAAQMLALMTDGLWLDLARRANAKARRLADAVEAGGGRLLAPVETNAVFAALSAATHRRALEAGALYHLWTDHPPAPGAEVPVRLVCAWDTPDEQVAAFADVLSRTGRAVGALPPSR